MFLASQVIDYVKADLDAEGSDRYTFDQDYKPAINKAITWLMLAFNQVFDKKRTAGENLKELKYARVFLTNFYSRIGFDEADLGHKVWTLIDVMPEPVISPADFSIGSISNKSVSRWVKSLMFVSSEFSAARSTDAQWSGRKRNIFMQGNELLKESSMRSYAYLEANNYTSTKYEPSVAIELEITPSLSNKLVGVKYLKKPDEVTTEDSEIEFPDNLLVIMSEKVSNFISYKQGDGTSLYAVTEADIQRLLSLI